MMKEFDFLKKMYANTPERLNDRLRMPITDKYGSCMSLYNPDLLDRASLSYARELIENQPGAVINAVDIGASPYCPQALRLASLGLLVDAFDLEPPIQELSDITRGIKGGVNYHQVDLTHISHVMISDNYHLFYANRCLLFLRYGTVQIILQKFINKLRPRSRGYLSLGYIDSRDVKEYPDRDKNIEDRFAIASSQALRAAGVNAPVCLYSLDEAEQLLEKLPIHVLTLDRIGNTLNAIKVIFEKIN